MEAFPQAQGMQTAAPQMMAPPNTEADRMQREQKVLLDKQLTVKEIVSDERNILNERWQHDMEVQQTQNAKQVQSLERNAHSAKNKSEQLQRVLLEKEATLLQTQGEVARLQSELNSGREANELMQTKLKALQQYANEIQDKSDSLEKQNAEKAAALGELMQGDLPARLIDYKRQLDDLRGVLGQKEREKEQYLANFELGPHEGFSKQLLERQSENLMD
jgi:chromosome segregation ATPase